MHSLWTRLHAIFACTLSALTAMTFAFFLSTAFNNYSTDVRLSTVKVVVKSVPDYTVSKEELDLGVITFDIDANLTQVFNWNVKQLFLYLAAEYETKNNKVNQVVLWDKIIQRGQDPILKLSNLHSKYYFWDDGRGLRDIPVKLSLNWNVIPNAGILPNFAGIGSHTFKFPVEYAKNARV
ncbi:signal peptidase complex subunit 3-like [Tropilaelaps mercedesae]|uniref:Signal peptidase complex subunit 3 n=1 Tax=Tropilaelaps mercedesae TaxID=418985 RepID=A0A1V9X674_9ACAR|nr:signal peptidase complex subunit 3-like [Tropilaelaps mercedesae]